MPLLQNLAKILRVFGFNAYEAAISPAGKAYDLYQRMKLPVPGDLVFEPGTLFHADDEDHINAMGYLIESGEIKGKAWVERFTRILTLDGREERWTNASFLALPSEKDIKRQPVIEENLDEDFQNSCLSGRQDEALI